MRRSIVICSLAGALAVSASAAVLFAQAKINVKLGLWEINSVSKEMGPSDPQKICITAEKLASGAFDDPPHAVCKHTITGQTATTMDVKATCTSTDPPMSGTSTMHVEAVSPTSVKGTNAITMNAGGGPMTMTNTFTSKFLAASCGDIK